MIIQKPRVLLPERALSEDLMLRLERYARVCYKSETKIGEEYNARFLQDKIRMGHESIIEHEKATVMFVIDRGVSHEIVRHRIAAYSQESTRYCRYDRDKFGNEISVIEPYFFLERPEAWQLWLEACETAERKYMEMLQSGCSAQEARSVLPNSLKTEIVVTYNMREWRHFFRLRCDAASHPQMRQVAIPLLLAFRGKLPVLFGGIDYDTKFPAQYYAQVLPCDDLFNPLP
ncbi:MAG: FAD-dependent thymidylate synthase [Syntrophomonas sp.]